MAALVDLVRQIRGSSQPDIRSEAESLLVDLCRQSGLPLPATNVLVEGFLVDAFWPRHGLIVEVDGYEFHRTRQAFERDRERDAVLTLAGYRVLRVTYRRLLHESAAVANTIRSLLGRWMS
jgi:very-short-patch-repair endonuclease